MPGPTKRALILAGGGLKVGFQAGVLQVWLDEAGLTFDHADGASGGCFNLAMYCQGQSGTKMADNWRDARSVSARRFELAELLAPRAGPVALHLRQLPREGAAVLGHRLREDPRRQARHVQHPQLLEEAA